MRDYEEACRLRRRTLYRVLATEAATGRLVAHTTVVIEREDPTWAEQHDTVVVPAHRGHRLGLLLKTAMVGWLAEAEPQVRRVSTWNAESNEHMIAVNETLGYRWTGRKVAFQR
jgi:RimJ/RimL family protein N-acetyltransferase